MEIEHLQEFITLAQQGNFLSAAEDLYISQSSLSKHIKSIEAELGVSLFDRTTRKVHLSRFGEAYLPYAERITTLHREAKDSLTLLSRDTDESLRLGVLPVFSVYNIYERLSDFKKKYQNFTVNLTEGSNNELLNYLVNGYCNLILMRYNETGLGPHFATIPFAQDRLIMAIPPQHPLNDGRTSISLQELDGMDFITSTSAFITSTLNNLTETTGVRFNLVTRLNHSAEVIKIVLRENLPALLMKTPTEMRHSSVVKILDIEPAITNTVAIVYMKGKPLNSAAKGFIKILFPDWKEETHG